MNTLYSPTYYLSAYAGIRQSHIKNTLYSPNSLLSIIGTFYVK